MTTYLLILCGLAAAAVWGVILHFLATKRAKRDGGIYAEAVLTLYGLTTLVGWMLGNRKPHLDFTQTYLPTTLEGVWGQLAPLVFLMVALSSIIYRFTTRRWTRPSAGQTLFLAYIGFALTMVLSMIGGTNSGLLLPLFVTPIAFVTVYLFVNGETDRLLRILRRVSLTYVWVSLALAVLDPSSVFDHVNAARPTLLLGLASRLIGVTAHPNSLGSIAALALLLVLVSQREKARIVNGIAAATVLVMTDSRMAIAGTVFACVVLFIYSRERGRRARMMTTMLVALIPMAAVLSVNSPSGQLASLTGSRVAPTEIESLNGRTQVWTITMNEWKRNKLFGYGPNLWAPAYRAQFGPQLSWVGQAHNQFVQSLGEAGIVGLAGLLVYLIVLIRMALRGAQRSHGLTLALVLFLLVRMLADSSLRNPAMEVLTWSHLATFAVVLAYLRASFHNPVLKALKREEALSA